MIENLQRHTVNVQKPNPTKGTSGAEVDNYTTTVSNMPCLVLDASATWKVFYQQRKQDVTHQVFTNQGPTIVTGYQLIWNPGTGNKTLRVIGVTDKGGKGQVMQIDCQELA
jgi:hypothetical protein